MKNTAGIKEMLIRAARTFVQAAVGYAAANVALINWSDQSAVKKTVVALFASAVACGVSAIMNIPKKDGDA